MNQSFTSFRDFRQRYPIRPNDEGTLLGSGSYGRVFKVEDQLETEWVAIKISEFKGNDTKSLKAEVELAQRVPRQANIARYDACYRLETDTSVSDFAIMKYYPDGNLADLIRRETLTSEQICDLARGILLGLQHLHRHRIVHRDFKPANILISRDETKRLIPKIADFGLSKLVSDEELDSSDFDLSDGRGTPSYKAPEQIEGSRVSFNLDLWAFGVILYELLTGEKPFRADARNASEQSVRREIEKKIMTVELPARIGQIPEPYQAIIRRCLVRDIRERARREDELLDLLDGIPTLLTDAKKQADAGQYEPAIALYERVLAKRERHAEAEKELARCQSLLNAQRLNALCNRADSHVAKHQFEEAKADYEQVLRMDPTHSAAARGLAFCVDKLRPEPVALNSPVTEKTDVYGESTDVYQPLEFFSNPAPSKVATVSEVAVAQPVTKVSGTEVQPQSQPIVSQPKKDTRKRVVPWQVMAPVGVGLVALGMYYNWGTTKPPGTHSPPGNTVAIVTPTGGPKLPAPTPEAEVTTGETVVPPSNEAAKAIGKRIDVAFAKASQAYLRKDYEAAAVLTNSALGLDPTRKDVIRLRDAAVAASQKPTGEAVATPTNTVKPEPEPTKPTVVAPVVEEEKLVSEKQQAQEKYDQLVEAGLLAISNGNNKTKAIADFNQARSLAKEHDLNTARADGAYSIYVAKADKIFDSEEYDGAKGWYNVAQALKDTPEVRRKIKQCSNQ